MNIHHLLHCYSKMTVRIENIDSLLKMRAILGKKVLKFKLQSLSSFKLISRIPAINKMMNSLQWVYIDMRKIRQSIEMMGNVDVLNVVATLYAAVDTLD